MDKNVLDRRTAVLYLDSVVWIFTNDKHLDCL